MEQMSINLMEAVSLAIQRAKLWRLPPNWNERQWNDELRSIAWSSAWEAYHTFDPERNIPLQVFVFLRVKKALWDFYRREWEYACHCISPPDRVRRRKRKLGICFAVASTRREGMAADGHPLGTFPIEREGTVRDRAVVLGRVDRSGNRSRIGHKPTDGQQN